MQIFYQIRANNFLRFRVRACTRITLHMGSDCALIGATDTSTSAHTRHTQTHVSVIHLLKPSWLVILRARARYVRLFCHPMCASEHLFQLGIILCLHPCVRVWAHYVYVVFVHSFIHSVVHVRALIQNIHNYFVNILLSNMIYLRTFRYFIRILEHWPFNV